MPRGSLSRLAGGQARLASDGSGAIGRDRIGVASFEQRLPGCRVNSRKRFCHSEGWLTRVTCTAVTLYSGQLVAQSELSVVITFAPDSGKWNVV